MNYRLDQISQGLQNLVPNRGRSMAKWGQNNKPSLLLFHRAGNKLEDVMTARGIADDVLFPIAASSKFGDKIDVFCVEVSPNNQGWWRGQIGPALNFKKLPLIMITTG